MILQRNKGTGGSEGTGIKVVGIRGQDWQLLFLESEDTVFRGAE